MARQASRLSLRTLSIKRKLMLITMSTSTVALLLASVGFVVFDLVAFRNQMSDDLMTQAEIVGANSMAALAFSDGPAAREILSALKARESIVAAALYAPDGALLADYRRVGSSAGAVPTRPDASGSRFQDNYLRVSHQIEMHGQVLGTVYVESDMQEWDDRLKRYTGIVVRPDPGIRHRGAPALVPPAADDFGADSGPAGDHAERVGATELRPACGQDERR